MKRLDFDAPATMERAPKWRRIGAFKVLDADGPTGNSEPQRQSAHVNLWFGKPVRRTKTDKCSLDRLRFRYTNISQFGLPRSVGVYSSVGTTSATLPANYPFLNYKDGISSSTRSPFFVLSLTSAPQFDGLNKKAAACCCVPRIEATSGDVSFIYPGITGGSDVAPEPSLRGFAADGTRTNDWQLYSAGVNDSANTTVGPRAILERSDITLQLWGQTGTSTTYRVMLVQFEEENVPLFNDVPAAATTNIGTTATYGIEPGLASTKGDPALFWGNWMKKTMFNPDYKAPQATDTGMKIMYQRYIQLEPKQTTDDDTQPQMFRFRMNCEFHRYCNYAWSNTGGTLTEAFMESSAFNRQLGNVRLDVAPAARVFLVVTATNYKPAVTTTATFTAAEQSYMPCMDFDVINTFAVNT